MDIALGGMVYGFVDATSLGISINNHYGPKLIEYGERIKDALQKAPFVPVHPENPAIRGVSILQFTEPLHRDTMTAVNTVVVSPGDSIGARVAQEAVQGWQCSMSWPARSWREIPAS